MARIKKPVGSTLTRAVKANPLRAGIIMLAVVLVGVYVVARSFAATTTVTINDNITGTGIGQWEYLGSGWGYYTDGGLKYQGDDHSSSAAGDTATLRFNGTQVKYYGPKSPQAGIVGVSVDGGAETMIDLYQATRVDNTLLYTSPSLPNANHSLKIRLTGNKNPSAVAAAASVDRADVTSGTVGSGLLGDVNGNGKVDVFDLSIMLSKWNTADPASDFNSDGTVTVFDLSILLSHWGSVATPSPTATATATATPTATPQPTSTPVGGTLPSKIVAGYWQMYQGPNVSEITANAPQYNLQYAAFAMGNGGGGTASFNPAWQSAASLKTDIAASKAKGSRWLISIGGGVPQASQVMLRNQTEANQLVNSLIPIIDNYGFEGIDFDLENGPDGWAQAPMKSVAVQLKAHYGSKFIVSMAPRPYETFYYDTAVAMGDAVDLVGLQFYDYSETSNSTFLRGWIRDKVNELVGRGIPASKIVIGCITYYPEYGNGSNTVATYRDAYIEMNAKYPSLRGVFIWETSLDKKKNWEFARVMGQTVRGMP